jgi:hypothetical protein
MKALSRPNTVAAILLMIPAMYALGVWYIMLFVGNSAEGAWLGQLQYTFSAENTDRWWFVWFAVLPVICIGLAISYALGLAANHVWAHLLFVTATLILVVNFALTAWFLAFLTALPLYWAYLCMRLAQGSGAPRVA